MNTINAQGRSTQGQYSDVIEQSRNLVNRAVLDGGVTLNRNGGDVPSTGYVVGGKVPSLVLEWGKLSYDQALGRVADWLGAQPRFGSGNNYVGSWFDKENRKLYFDLVDVIEDSFEAFRTGYQRGELAVWDIDNAQEIRLNLGQSIGFDF